MKRLSFIIVFLAFALNAWATTNYYPPDEVNVLSYGAVGDCVQTSNSSGISTGTNTLTVTGGSFAATDVGKVIVVQGAGTAGADLKTTISGYTSATQVTLTANASTSVMGKISFYGTNDTTAFTNAIAAAANKTLVLPNKKFLVDGDYSIAYPMTVNGRGATIYLSTSAKRFVQITSNNVFINNLTIVPTENNATSIIRYYVDTVSINKIGLSDVRVLNPLFYAYGTSLPGSAAVPVWNGGLWSGIEFAFNTSSARGYVSNVFTNIMIAGGTYGIKQTAASGAAAYFNGNTLTNIVTKGCQTGLYTASGTTFTGNIISSIVLEPLCLSCSGTGISLQGTAYGNEIHISSWWDNYPNNNTILNLGSSTSNNRIYGYFEGNALTDSGTGNSIERYSAWWNAIGTTLPLATGLGTTSPTARLHLGAGSATAGTAPLKLTAGTLLSSPEAGALEFDGTHFYGTISSTRYQLDRQNSTISYGDTVPSSPTAGTYFLHTPTGRSVLLQYNGTSWIPLNSYGTMTVYVDGASGSNAIDKGYGTGANAFKTIQYAMNAIPKNIGGNVTVNVTATTYSELVYINDKYSTGASGTSYSITIQGTRIEVVGAFTATSYVDGTGATRGSVTKNGQFVGVVAGDIVYNSGLGVYRTVYSNSGNNTLTIVGTWGGTPSGTTTVYRPGTIISGGSSRAYGINISSNSCIVYIYDISVTSPTNAGIVISSINRGVYIYRSTIAGGAESVLKLSSTNELVALYQCYLVPSGSAYGIWWTQGTRETVMLSWSLLGATTGTNILVNQGNLLNMRRGSTILHSSAGTGISCIENSIAKFDGLAGDGYESITGCTDGIIANTGGQVTGTANNIYSGNTRNETATSASFGCID